MKHRIFRANTESPRVLVEGYATFADMMRLADYCDELVWHFKNGRK